jgi:RNA polymerase sigma-70 factor (ECF subfamily)
MAENFSPGGARESVAALSALALRARAGDAEAFEQIMVCTQHRIATTAWRLLGSREDARDATQEAYLRAYKYLKSYRPEQDFHGWLYRIAINVCRDMMRERRGFEAHENRSSLDANSVRPLAEAIASDADTEQAVDIAEKRAIVGRALETLPERERTALVLRDLEGLSTEEVAKVMNTRAATVRSQLSTARAKLKRYCEKVLQGRRELGGRDL